MVFLLTSTAFSGQNSKREPQQVGQVGKLSNTKISGVHLTLKRMGFEKLKFWNIDTGALDSTFVNELQKFENKNNEYHIRLVYTTDTSKNVIQYNGNIQALIYKMPADLNKKANCTLSLDINSEFLTPNKIEGSFDSPTESIVGNCKIDQ